VSRPADVRRVRPQVKALLELVKRAKLGLQFQNEVSEQALRLERAAGKLLKETVPVRKRGGSKARGAPLKEAIEDLGVHKRTAQRWERLADVDDIAFETYLAESKLAEREITSIDLLRRFKPGGQDDGPWLWPNWPDICSAFEQARRAIYLEFANRERGRADPADPSQQKRTGLLSD
jgi:hypothetical protein